MEIQHLSTLYTISFTRPRLNPDRDGDFCLYFALESSGSKTIMTDLALFIRAIGRQLIKWTVLGNPDRLSSGNPAHPVLRDLAYSWDGVACAYGVLQFSAIPVSIMNIRRMFHRTSKISGPFCHTHRYEYFLSGILSDVPREMISLVFTEMEVAAQYVYPPNFLLFLFVHNFVLGSYAMTTPFSLMSKIVPSVSHVEYVRLFLFCFCIRNRHVSTFVSD